MSEENMNNCKAEPINGEMMIRDPIDDLSRLVGMIDFTQDAGVKAVLRATIVNMIQKHFGIDNENIRGRVVKICADEFMRCEIYKPNGGGENVSKPVTLHSLWKRQANPEISYILFQHIYDFIKENDR